MAWYPSAIRRDIGRTKTALVNPQRVTLHTAVTNANSLAGAFKDGPYCHFYVRADGTVEQHQDTAYRAAADLQGNDNTVSIETWDAYRESAPNKPIPYDGNGVSGWRSTSDVPAWTDKQITALIALLQWLWKTHPSIPRKLATDSKIGTSSHGVAWHKLGVPSTSGATVSQTGGMLWSTSAGKVCPGARRIAQVPLIFARAAGTATPTTTTPTGGATMTPQQIQQLLADLSRCLEILKNADPLLYGGELRRDIVADLKLVIDEGLTKSTAAILQALAGVSVPGASTEALQEAVRGALSGLTLRVDPPTT